MAKVQGQSLLVSDWNDTEFKVCRLHDKMPQDVFSVSPLDIMLHEHEMQEWARDPRGMDKMYEPDLMRPGKFKSTSARRA